MREIIYLSIGVCSWFIATILVFSLGAHIESTIVGLLVLGLACAGLFLLIRDPFTKNISWPTWSERSKLEKLYFVAIFAVAMGIGDFLPPEIPELLAALKNWKIQIGMFLFYVYRFIRLHQFKAQLLDIKES